MAYSLEEKMRIDSILSQEPKRWMNLLHDTAEMLNIRSSDLANMTGWEPARVSKLLNHKQKPTVKDFKRIAMAIGRIFYLPKDNKRKPSLLLTNTVDEIDECLYSIYRLDSASRIDQEEDVLYELSVSIMNYLGLTPSEYAVNAKFINERFVVYENDDIDDGGYEDEGILIEFKHRNLSSSDDIPSFGVRASKDRKDWYWFVTHVDRIDHNTSQEIRKILSISKTDTIMSMDYSDINKLYFDDQICFFEKWRIDDESNSSIKYVVFTVFRYYCFIIDAMYGVDILPQKYHKMPEIINVNGKLMIEPSYDTQFISSSVVHNEGFSDDIVNQARTEMEYHCEIDYTHNSFKDDEGNEYMDIIPLVPFDLCAKNGINGQIIENAVCLCPMCSSKLIHGSSHDRTDMIMKLYIKKDPGLKNAGIDIKLGELLTYFDL